jgi:glycosyltransferase involved in cell wall biosynthesis
MGLQGMMLDTKCEMSIIVLFFNQEKFVINCLDSVFRENLSGIEVIISDDCSTDATYALCEEYVKNVKSNANRVVLNRNQRNIGITSHVNKLVNMASSDILVPLAGDDWFVLDKITKIKRTLKKSNYSMYVTDCYITNAEGEILKQYKYNGKTPMSALKMAIYGSAGIPGHTQAVWRKELFTFFGPLNEKILNEDEQLVFRAMLLNGIGVIEESLNHYRLHSNSVSAWWKNTTIGREIYIHSFKSIIENIINSYMGWQEAIDIAYEKARLSKNLHQEIAHAIEASIKQVTSLRKALSNQSFIKRLFYLIVEMPLLRNKYFFARLLATLSPNLIYYKLIARGSIRTLYYKYIKKQSCSF